MDRTPDRTQNIEINSFIIKPMMNWILSYFGWKLVNVSIAVPQLDEQDTIAVDNCDTNLLKLKYQFMLKCLETEHERMKSIEAKAAMFIGSTSIMGALLVGFSNLVISEHNFIKLLISFLLFVLVLLLARTILYSISTLKKRTYYMLEPKDIEDVHTEDQYYRKLIKDIETVIKFNQNVTNAKVDSMQNAQKSFNYFWIFAVVCIIILLILEFISVYNIYYLFDPIHIISSVFIVCFAAAMGYLVNGELVATTKN